MGEVEDEEVTTGAEATEDRGDGADLIGGQTTGGVTEGGQGSGGGRQRWG